MSNRKTCFDLATRVRKECLRMVHSAHASHIGSTLSIVDLLVVLYSDILNVDPSFPDWPDRDRFILSKGHACTGLYAILAEQNFFPREWLGTYCQNGSKLLGHITKEIPGVEFSTGSLGHGLSIGCGMALAGKRSNQSYRVFVLLSDGECDEGSIWEAALFAGHHKLDNLTVIIDYNKIQALGSVFEVLNLEPLSKKWQSFGWSTTEIDGHDFVQIEKTLSNIPLQAQSPTCVIAHTTKGKGVSFMENQLKWHYQSPDIQQLDQALSELDKLQ
jgi:transketolase